MYGKEYMDDKQAREAGALAVVAVKEAFKDLDQSQLSKAWAILRRHDPVQMAELYRQQNLMMSDQSRNAAANIYGVPASISPLFGGIGDILPRGLG